MRAVLRETRPTLANLGPFLQELNPILEWLEQNQREVSQFISNGIMAITDETESLDPLGRGHYLAQIGPIGAESIGVYRDRLPTNRGNAYVGPAQLDSRVKNIKSIIPSFDCNNAGGDQDPDTSLLTTAPGCLTQTPPDFRGRRDVPSAAVAVIVWAYLWVLRPLALWRRPQSLACRARHAPCVLAEERRAAPQRCVCDALRRLRRLPRPAPGRLGCRRGAARRAAPFL